MQKRQQINNQLITQQHQHDIIYNETSEISIAKEENNDNG